MMFKHIVIDITASHQSPQLSNTIFGLENGLLQLTHALCGLEVLMIPTLTLSLIAKELSALTATLVKHKLSTLTEQLKN